MVMINGECSNETSSNSCVFFLGCFKGFFLPPKNIQNQLILQGKSDSKAKWVGQNLGN
jgi:hypothetical protein